MSWRGEELLDVPRELGGPVDLGGARGDPLVGEDADGVAQRGLVLGQAIAVRPLGSAAPAGLVAASSWPWPRS